MRLQWLPLDSCHTETTMESWQKITVDVDALIVAVVALDRDCILDLSEVPSFWFA